MAYSTSVVDLNIHYARTNANFICLYMHDFMDLSRILQAVKCHAASNAMKVVTKPMPKYAIFSNISRVRCLLNIRLLDILFNN